MARASRANARVGALSTNVSAVSKVSKSHKLVPVRPKKGTTDMMMMLIYLSAKRKRHQIFHQKRTTQLCVGVSKPDQLMRSWSSSCSADNNVPGNSSRSSRVKVGRWKMGSGGNNLYNYVPPFGILLQWAATRLQYIEGTPRSPYQAARNCCCC